MNSMTDKEKYLQEIQNVPINEDELSEQRVPIAHSAVKANKEIGNYDHDKVDKTLLPELKEDTDSHEDLEGLLLAFALTFETKGKTLGECLEEFKPKIIDAAKKINTSTSDDLEKASEIYERKRYFDSVVSHKTDFINGAKWQKEQFEHSVKSAFEIGREQAKTEPVSEELVEAADFYSKLFSDIAAPYIRKDAFIAGANWQAEQFEKERLKHCDALTEEQYKLETGFIDSHIEKNNRTPTFIDSIEYGMALQEEKDNICYEEIIEEGAKWKYDEMMKDAVDGNIILDLNGDIKIDIGDKDPFRVGDKVKVIVIKED